jgi:transcriptional regulator with GAF, ATPase, and Fis domain
MGIIYEMREASTKAEREAVVSALMENAWSLTASARALGVCVSSMQSLIKTHGLADEYARLGSRASRPKQGG